jgi:hypothetical protein
MKQEEHSRLIQQKTFLEINSQRSWQEVYKALCNVCKSVKDSEPKFEYKLKVEAGFHHHENQRR